MEHCEMCEMCESTDGVRDYIEVGDSITLCAACAADFQYEAEEAES